MRLSAAIIPMWLFVALSVHAEVKVPVCFNYGCSERVMVRFTDADMLGVREVMLGAGSAVEERKAIPAALVLLYRAAGQQTPIHADRGGNLLDAGVQGRMDCIDHSTTTTSFLDLIASRELLRFHRVREPARRARFFSQHFSAVIEVVGEAEERGGSYAVDSWFVDHGQPALMIPLDEWLGGGGPNAY